MKSIALNDNTYWDATGVYDSTFHKTQHELNEQNDSAIAAKYTKPSTGIPKDHLAQSVISSLNKADSALQTAPVDSVNGKTGAVALSAADVGALPSSTFIPSDTSDLTNGADFATRAEIGTPLVASTASEMTDTSKVYVYTGSETGYTNGDWYYYDGSAWASGGVYNSVAVQTDKTLAVPDMAADAKKTGDELRDLKSAIKMPTNLANSTSWGSGYISRTSGKVGSSSNVRHTDFINISGLSKLVYTAMKTTGTSTPSNGIAFYESDNEDSYLSGKASAYGASELGDGLISTIDVPPDANFARFSWWNENLEKLSFIVCDAEKYADQIQIIVEQTKNLLNFVDLQTVLDSDATIENCVITSDGDVYPGGSRYSYQIANNGYGSIQLTAGNADTFISFLIDSVTGVSSRTPANICNGQPPRITITALSTETLQIPSDCQYIIIAKQTSSGDITPANGYFIKQNSPLVHEAAEKDVYYPFDDLGWRIGCRLTPSNAVLTIDQAFALTDLLPIEGGDEIVYSGQIYDSNNSKFVCNVLEFDGDLKYGGASSFTKLLFSEFDNAKSLVVKEGTKFVRFAFGYADSTKVMTKAICKEYFAAKTTRKPSELNRPSLNILFIGNSKAYDSVMYAPAILKSLGVDANINIGIIYHGGQGLEEHYKAFVADEKTWCNLSESVNLTPWRNVLGEDGRSGLDCFTHRKWDVISFQQATTKAGNYNYYKPWLNGIIEYINDNVDYKWKMAWNNVDTTSAGCDPDELDYNSDKMPGNATKASHEITEEHYYMVISALQDMLAENPVEIVFPVATATQNARNTILASLGDNEQLLYDWKHAQEGIPCLIEGYTIAIKLMELLGIHNKSVLNDRTVVNRDFLTAWKVQGRHGSPVGFEDEITGDSNRKIAQKCAILACQRPMELSNIVTDLPANYPNAYPS